MGVGLGDGSTNGLGLGGGGGGGLGDGGGGGAGEESARAPGDGSGEGDGLGCTCRPRGAALVGSGAEAARKTSVGTAAATRECDSPPALPDTLATRASNGKNMVHVPNLFL